MFLFSHEFSTEQKRRNFEYYDALTTGDSSLSSCVQGIVAFEVGDAEKAREYARVAAFTDLADVAGNVKDGCHIASMGGLWMMIVYDLAGMRDYEGRLKFRPQLPGEVLEWVRFPVTVRGQLLEVQLYRAKRTATYSLLEGAKLVIEHEGEDITVCKGVPVVVPISSNSSAANA